MSDKKLNLEEKMKTLEKISKELENPELGLAQSMESYKKAMGLIKECQLEIEEAEAMIKIISKNDKGGFEETEWSET